MPGENGNRDGNVTQDELDRIAREKSELEAKLKKIEDEKRAAEALAEKYRKDNDEARKIMDSQGSELDVLKKKLGEPGDDDKRKKEPTLQELEEAMTDEDWATADKFLETVTDQALKRKIVYDDKERVRVLKLIKGDVALQPAPTSFRRKEEKRSREDDVKDLFENFKKSHGFVPAGPGTSFRSSPGSSGMSGPTVWPSDKSRKQDSRVK